MSTIAPAWGATGTGHQGGWSGKPSRRRAAPAATARSTRGSGGGVAASEKCVRRVMSEEGLRPACARHRRRGYSSYEGEVSTAPPNLVGRDFHALALDELWLTDVSEFRLPSGEKVYPSPVVDCFDGMSVSWSVGRHPDKALANSSPLKALGRRHEGFRTVIRSDHGGHYRWPEWIAIREGCRPGQERVGQGVQPGQRRVRGLL